jgi:hypothetical protein
MNTDCPFPVGLIVCGNEGFASALPHDDMVPELAFRGIPEQVFMSLAAFDVTEMLTKEH